MTPSSLPRNNAVAGNIVALIDKRKPSLKLQREIEVLLDRSYPTRRRKVTDPVITKQLKKALKSVQLTPRKRSVLLSYAGLHYAVTSTESAFRSKRPVSFTRLCLESLIKKGLLAKRLSETKPTIAFFYPTALGKAWLAANSK